MSSVERIRDWFLKEIEDSSRTSSPCEKALLRRIATQGSLVANLSAGRQVPFPAPVFPEINSSLIPLFLKLSKLI
jgi:hypothetical protein